MCSPPSRSPTRRIIRRGRKHPAKKAFESPCWMFSAGFCFCIDPNESAPRSSSFSSGIGILGYTVMIPPRKPCNLLVRPPSLPCDTCSWSSWDAVCWLIWNRLRRSLWLARYTASISLALKKGYRASRSMILNRLPTGIYGSPRMLDWPDLTGCDLRRSILREREYPLYRG